MKTINLNDYTQTGDGFTAVSYTHRDGGTMVKLYADFIPDEVPEKEVELANDVAALGIHIPKALGLVKCGNQTGAEFELISGKRSFSRAMADEPGNFEAHARRFARICKQLHETPCNTSVFPHASARFIDAVNRSPLLSADEKKKALAFIDSVPAATTCVHGDMHFGNVIMRGDEYWWIDIADFGWGNPLFDLGMFYFVCQMPDEGIVSNLFHMDCAHMRHGWDIFADEYFGPEADIKAIEKECGKFASLLALFHSLRVTYDWMRPYIEENLLKLI